MEGVNLAEQILPGAHLASQGRSRVRLEVEVRSGFGSRWQALSGLLRWKEGWKWGVGVECGELCGQDWVVGVSSCGNPGSTRGSHGSGV